MLDLVLPKIECEALTKQYGRFIIGPLETGYGITLGNSLRRIMLSSLSGAAITSVKIEGIHHEFSPIPNVKEDTMSLILNLKQVRFKMHGEGPARLQLVKSGEGVLTAADIICPSEVEIINPDLYLATLDSKDAYLEMELTVEQGRGYSPSEERGKLPIGVLPVDAIFTPIRKVAYNVGRMRVGPVTDFDRLSLEVWTDGSISPQEALSTAAQFLGKHLSLVMQFGGITEETQKVEEAIPARLYETPIEDLDLSVRAFNCLKRAGITKVGEVLERLSKGDEEILSIRNFGQKSLEELKQTLKEKGFLKAEEASSEESQP